MDRKLLSNETDQICRIATNKKLFVCLSPPRILYKQLKKTKQGIIGLGAFICFGTEARDFSKLFPGVKIHLLTLATNFNVPLWRDLLLHLGFCSASRKSCETLLNDGPGSSICLVPGGAAESLYAFPGTYDLVIKKRLGFIKIALRNGSSLVPVIGFGENDIWNQVENPKGSILRTMQTTFQKYSTVAPPLFSGRGVFQYSFGLMPFRRPVTVVVGEPIDCPRIEEPSDEDLRKYQELYFGGLRKVFDDYKEVYAGDRKGELFFVE